MRNDVETREPFRTPKILGFGALIGFVATIVAIVAFDILGGGSIVYNGEPMGDGLMQVIVIVPFVNAIIAAPVALGAYFWFLSNSRTEKAATFIAVAYAVGTIVAWLCESAPFVPYYAITGPLIYLLGPLAVLIASVARKVREPRSTTRNL